jgi:hypothetical protein
LAAAEGKGVKAVAIYEGFGRRKERIADALASIPVTNEYILKYQPKIVV